MTYEQVIAANAREREIWRDQPLQRKLPPDWVIGCLIRFGFTHNDIADRFEVSKNRVYAAARRLNLPLVQPEERWRRRSGMRTSPIYRSHKAL